MKIAHSYYITLLIALICAITFGFTAQQKELKQDEKNISLKEYNQIISRQDKMVLVYFSAKWCQVCPKLKPIIDDLENERAAKVQILRIDTDRDKEIAEEFEIDALPVLFLYKNGKREWIQVGLIEKQKLYTKIDSYN